MHKESWFIDTVVLSNFAFAEKIDLLAVRYGQNLKITEEVYHETLAGISSGYSKLAPIVECIHSRTFQKIELTAKERQTCFELMQNLGKGEASCIATAQSRHGVVITDDRLARLQCQERNILFTGTIGILKALCQNDLITVREADAILNKMISFGFYSPVRRISDIFP